MKPEFPLRERKRARLRLSLLEGLLALLAERDLGQISVEQLCERADTNKVTFFQHFIHKEQLLDYFVCRWQYDRSQELESGKYSGAEGLRAVFHSVAENPFGLKVMVSLASYYTRLREKPVMPDVSDCEYWMFNASAYEAGVKARGLNDLFLHYMSQIPSIAPERRRELLEDLVVLFYGVPVQMHIMGSKAASMAAFYARGLAALLGRAD